MGKTGGKRLAEAISLQAAAELAALRESDSSFDVKQTLPNLQTIMAYQGARGRLVLTLERWLSTATGTTVSVRSKQHFDALLRMPYADGGDLIDRAELIRGTFLGPKAPPPGMGSPPDFIYENMSPYLLFGNLRNYRSMVAAFLERYFREPDASQRLGRIHFERWPKPSMKSWQAYSQKLMTATGQGFQDPLPTIAGRNWKEAYISLVGTRLGQRISDPTLFRLAAAGRQLHASQMRLQLVSMWAPHLGLPKAQDYDEPHYWQESTVTRRVSGLKWYEHWHVWRPGKSLMEDLIVPSPLSESHFVLRKHLNLHGFKLGSDTGTE